MPIPPAETPFEPDDDDISESALMEALDDGESDEESQDDDWD